MVRAIPPTAAEAIAEQAEATGAAVEAVTAVAEEAEAINPCTSAENARHFDLPALSFLDSFQSDRESVWNH
jgi:hypothetical protein